MRLQSAEPRLILASASAARAALLAAAGLHFEAVAASVDEAAIKRSAQSEAMDAPETALLLAELKAERVARRHPDALVIGADQMLLCDGRWFDKPGDVNAARLQLRDLRGKPHVLVTSVLCWRHGRRIWHHLARPKLTMRAFSDEFLEIYLESEGEAVTTTVGGYRLEGLGMQLFDAIDGEHAAILGLPMLALLGFLRQHGVVQS